MTNFPDRPKPLDSRLRFCDLDWRSYQIDDVLEDLFSRDGCDPIVPMAMASELEKLLPGKLPRKGSDFAQVKATLSQLMNGFSRRNRHPGFMAYICSPGLPSDWSAFAWVAALNQNVTSFGSAPASITLERQLIRWLNDMIGFPHASGGLLTSGGSMANFSALATALHEFVGPKLRECGYLGLGTKSPYLVYANPSAHFSIVRAASVIGLGTKNVRNVPIDAQGRMRIDVLKNMLSSDYHSGAKPFCVVATAGTTSTGAIDPLVEIAHVCRDNGLWMHVDGAYGAGAMICQELRDKFSGIELADSVTIDLHKWLYSAIDASALLLREPKQSHDLFYTNADYVQIPEEVPAEQYAIFHYGLETSRRLRALPFVIAVMHFGADRIAANILHNARCADYLAKRVVHSAELGLVSPAELSICCFRFEPSSSDYSSEIVDQCNRLILERLNAEGHFHLSECKIDNRPVLRVCITNVATEVNHIDELLESVLRLGREFLSKLSVN